MPCASAYWAAGRQGGKVLSIYTLSKVGRGNPLVVPLALLNQLPGLATNKWWEVADRRSGSADNVGGKSMYTMDFITCT